MRAFLLPLLVATAICSAASAGHGCDSYATSMPEIDPGPTPLGQWYADNDICQPECYPNYAWWVYEETNGLPGLQRDDYVVDDTCHGMIAADTLIF